MLGGEPELLRLGKGSRLPQPLGPGQPLGRWPDLRKNSEGFPASPATHVPPRVACKLVGYWNRGNQLT